MQEIGVTENNKKIIASGAEKYIQRFFLEGLGCGSDLHQEVSQKIKIYIKGSMCMKN